MKFSSLIILALAPGRREFGVAVFDGGELVHFSLREFRKRRSDELLINQTTRFLQQLVIVFKPDEIAIKAISKYQSRSDVLVPIIKTINRLAKSNGIPIREVSHDEMKARPSEQKKPTLKKAFQQLTVIYPELLRFWNRPNRSQDKYYHNLFSAVAVGAACLELPRTRRTRVSK